MIKGSKMAYIGIDLGTTNTLVAIKKYGIEKPKVLLVREESTSLEEEIQFFIPSVVVYKEGELIAGWDALELAKQEEKTAPIFSIKRLMGRGYNEKDDKGNLIRERIEKDYRYAVGIPEGGTEEDIVVNIDEVRYTPQEISAAILREAVKVAKRVLGEEIEGAVITVPSYFNDQQRWATREAAYLANINVQKILSEPEASAKAYGLYGPGRKEQETVLVYDLGGGTFDITFLVITGTQFDNQEQNGDMWLGGDDFDNEIVNYLLSQLTSDTKERVQSSQRWMYILKERAREVKHKLSDSEEATIKLDDTPLHNRVNNIIKREKFEELIAPYVAKTMKLVDTVLTAQACEPDWTDKVVLVGGSTRISLVRKKLAEKFGEEKIISQIHPMKAVAEGSAIESSWLLDKIECPSCKRLVKKGNEKCSCGYLLPKTIEVTERPYGIEKKEKGKSKFDPIIPKGRSYPLPKPAEKEYTISNPNARILKVPLFAGEKDEKTGKPYQENTENNKHLGTIWMELPKGLTIPAKVTVGFNISKDRILDDVSVLCGDQKINRIIVRASQEEKICTATEGLLKQVINAWESIESKKREALVQIACDAIGLVIEGKKEEAEEKNRELEQELEKIKITLPVPSPVPLIPDPIEEAKNILRNLRAKRQQYSWFPYFRATVQDVMEEERWAINQAALLEFYHSQPGVEPSLDSDRELIDRYGNRTIEEVIVIAEGQLEGAIRKKDFPEIEFRCGILIHLIEDRGLKMILEIHAVSQIAKELSKKSIPNLSPIECLSDAEKLEQAVNIIEEFLKREKVQEAKEVYEQVKDLISKYIIANLIYILGRKPTEEEINKAREDKSFITVPESIGGK